MQYESRKLAGDSGLIKRSIQREKYIFYERFAIYLYYFLLLTEVEFAMAIESEMFSRSIINNF